MVLRALVLSMVAVAVMGCSSSSPEDPPPKAPRLTELAPMTGAIHVTWVNEEPACDTIEIERRLGAAPFAVVYSVPGSVDNKHDASATERSLYTYRLRCKHAAVYSSYSNELSATPTP